MGSAVAIAGRSTAPVTVAATDARRRYAKAACWAGAASVALYLWVQPRLLDQRVFSNFYDIQARALLDGDLAVPAGSLGNEAFAVRGHEFLYNPPGPSLLRLPVLLVTDRFDGRLTALSMLVAYGITVVLVALLVWRVRTLLRPAAVLTRWEATGLGVLLVAATAGSTMLYLGSVPWVFHEAYAWAIAMSIGVGHALIGVVARPSIRGALGVGAFTLGAVLSRATAGMACGAAVALAGLWLLWRGRSPTPRAGWSVVVAGALPVLVGATVNWAKFRHPWLFPIEDQVFSAVSASRRDAIAANGGDLFGVGLLRSTVPAYLRPDGIRFSGLFPFITLPAEPAGALGGNVFDRTYRTGSVVAFMPLLVLLGVLGSVRAFRRDPSGATVGLRFAIGGLALVPVGVLFGGYIAHRYTSEFVPLLVVTAVVGAVDLAERAEAATLSRRRLVLGGCAALAAFGVVANLAVAATSRAYANPGAVLAHHLDRQAELSAGAFADRVEAVAALPADAPAEAVRIVGACQAVFVATGEDDVPWAELGTRPIHLRFTRSENEPVVVDGALELARFTGLRNSRLVLQRDGDRYRLAVAGGGYDDEGPWFAPGAGEEFVVEVVTDDPEEYVVRLRADDGTGRNALTIPKQDHDPDWFWQPNVLAPVSITPQQLAGEGVLVQAAPTEAPGSCEDWLADHLGADPEA